MNKVQARLAALGLVKRVTVEGHVENYGPTAPTRPGAHDLGFGDQFVPTTENVVLTGRGKTAALATAGLALAGGLLLAQADSDQPKPHAPGHVPSHTTTAVKGGTAVTM